MRTILKNNNYPAYSQPMRELASTLLVNDTMSSQVHFRWEIPMSTPCPQLKQFLFSEKKMQNVLKHKIMYMISFYIKYNLKKS